MPFRDAHEIVGRLVLECERTGRTLQDLSATEFAQADPAFGPDALETVDIHAVVARRTSQSGTGNDAVVEQITNATDVLAVDVAWVEAREG